jgi:UDP-N-acetylmuramoyl-tripeptide--D-alanyl-D-alanine ligase
MENIYHAFLNSTGVCTDTRKILQGSIFFALKGPSFNANTFALKALELGASFTVIDEEIGYESERIFKVNDVLTALQQLATYHRNKFSIPVIGLTGSNGKTTTKELIAAVLKSTNNVLFTEGNLNNHIGVPLTLLQLKKHHNIAVIEMGANHQGEISLLCNIANPTHGLITNVGKAHLEGFGGFEGVIKGKTELYNYLKKNNGTIFCNSNNPFLKPLCKDYSSVIYYGNDKNAIVDGHVANSTPYLSVEWKSNECSNIYKTETKLTGEYNLENVLSAIAVGMFFSVDASLIDKSIEGYTPSNQRSQIVKKNSNTIILDAYNANPTSMSAALKNLEENYTGKKIIILGEMLELGNESLHEHKNILSQINFIEKENLILVGNLFLQADEKNTGTHFSDSDKAKEFIRSKNITNSTILIKGSRGSKMERVFDAF